MTCVHLQLAEYTHASIKVQLYPKVNVPQLTAYRSMPVYHLYSTDLTVNTDITSNLFSTKTGVW